MARRSRSKIHPLIPVAAGLLVLAAVLGAFYFGKENGDPYRTQEKLEISAYLDNANSLRGNVYKVEGEVMNDLAWSPSQGRLFSFGVDKNSSVIPILIPTSLNHLNIQKGQRFNVLIEVMDNGILRAKEMTKA